MEPLWKEGSGLVGELEGLEGGRKKKKKKERKKKKKREE
jgi:hypothetical protein